MESILNFDFAVFTWIENHLWCKFLDFVMTFITHLGDGGIIWIILAVTLLFFKGYRKFGIMIGAGLIISLIVNDNILKPFFERPRPFNLEDWAGIFNYPNLISKPESLSFPSGHTTSSFAAAIPLLFQKNKGIKIPALILAFLIAFSRIYVHVHYCTDVLAGIVAGTIYGLLAVLIVSGIYKFIENRQKKRLAA